MDIFGHQAYSGAHLGTLENCTSPDCRGIAEEHCDCSGEVNVLLTIEDNHVTDVSHPLCGRDLLRDSFQDGLCSDGVIPVRLRWEESQDWETGYTESWPVVTAREAEGV